MTKRVYDHNGWFEIPKNPLSRVGIFNYSAAQVGRNDGKTYRVYRPASELSTQDALNSFRLMPIIVDHEMLGHPAKGRKDAPDKGVHGVIGDNVVFDVATGSMQGNIKIFSHQAAGIIDRNVKKDISLGYTSKYDFTPGTFDGQEYDCIQRDIRGNHAAIVTHGRMGKQIAVLDEANGNPIVLNNDVFTFDTEDIIEMADTTDTAEPKLADVMKAIGDIGAKMATMDSKIAGFEAKLAEKPVVATVDTAAPKPLDQATMDAAIAAATKPLVDKIAILSDPKTAFAATARREDLVKKVSTFVGTFDHSEMPTELEVAKYAIDKLKIPTIDGAEVASVMAYLHGRTPPKQTGLFALPTTQTENNVVNFLKEIA